MEGRFIFLYSEAEDGCLGRLVNVLPSQSFHMLLLEFEWREVIPAEAPLSGVLSLFRKM